MLFTKTQKQTSVIDAALHICGRTTQAFTSNKCAHRRVGPVCTPFALLGLCIRDKRRALRHQ